MDYALVMGEALVDVVHRADGSVTEFPGGSAANVAVALRRLERPVRFATAFTADGYGALIRDHLERDGVVLATDPAAIDHTSSAVATIAADGSAQYEFDLEWRLNPLRVERDPLVVHTSSLGAVLSPGCSDVAAALERFVGAATISYDINARPSITGTGPEVVAAVERIVGLAEVVKASDEDIEALYPGRGLPASAQALLELGPVAVVITRGGEGAYCATRDGEFLLPAEPVVVADTIGAGDTFGAGLIDGLWTAGLLGAAARPRLARCGLDQWRTVLAHAARVAAVTVSRPGANPPYLHELR